MIVILLYLRPNNDKDGKIEITLLRKIYVKLDGIIIFDEEYYAWFSEIRVVVELTNIRDNSIERFILQIN